MSFGISAAAWAGIAAAAVAANTAVQYDQGRKAAAGQRDAAEEARRRANEQAKAADEAFNAQNRKAPNIQNLLSGNRGALGSTMLTGPAGVQISPSLLGRATLLGG